jgi:hypothetical protein
MDIKIVCGCGQKYIFEVDPDNGLMGASVTCPACGADGTMEANEILTQIFPEPAMEPVPPPPAAAAAGPIRVNLPVRPAVATQAGAAPLPLYNTRTTTVAAAAKPAKTPSFGMGLLGGLIGALVGAIVYFLIFKFTGLRIKFIAIGVGALAGWFADYLGKGEGSKELGGITAVFVLSGIIGAQYFVALGWSHESEDMRLNEAASAYANAMTEAEEVVKAIPTGSDTEIRAYLAKLAAQDGEKVPLASISNEVVKDFHDNQLPEYQQLAGGKISKEEYEKKIQIKTTVTEAEKKEDDYTFKGVFLLLLLSRANLFSLAAAAGLAFKMSANA